MANPNPQLEAALAQFTNQSGVTPDQVAQLRGALTADADRLKQLNQEAATGQLNGFALEAPGAAATLTGSYDKQAGIVTMSLSSFQPGGTTAGDDLKSAVGIQAMTVDFAHQTYQDLAKQSHTVDQDMVDNLQATLNGSPELARQALDAVKEGHLEQFAILDPGMSAGAAYDGMPKAKAMNLPAQVLQTNSTSSPQGRFDPKDLTFVMAHEIQHGFNFKDKHEATATFAKAIRVQAQVKGPVHEYTDEWEPFIQAGREDEAKAQIAGWNALLSREKQGNPNANLDDMLLTQNGRVLDFLNSQTVGGQTTAVQKAGLTFNQDSSLALDATKVDAAVVASTGRTAADIAAGNIAAMGQHYFGRPSPLHTRPGQRPVHIGEHKDLAGNPQPTADYINYYAISGVERILKAEEQANVMYQGARPRVTFDMARLGLKEDLIENEGLDLGHNKTPRPYYDSSTTPAVLHHFDHTQDGSVAPAQDHQYVPIVPTPSAASGRRTPEDPEHPDHATLERIRTGVRAVSGQTGALDDDSIERLSRSLLAATKDQRDAYPHTRNEPLAGRELSRVDQVVVGGGNLFAVEGRLDDPAMKRAFVNIEQAMQTPVEQSDQKLQAANQQITQEQTVTRQQELVQAQQQEAQRAPMLTR